MEKFIYNFYEIGFGLIVMHWNCLHRTQSADLWFVGKQRFLTVGIYYMSVLGKSEETKRKAQTTDDSIVQTHREWKGIFSQ